MDTAVGCVNITQESCLRCASFALCVAAASLQMFSVHAGIHREEFKTAECVGRSIRGFAIRDDREEIYRV